MVSGKSILETLWGELDSKLELLIADGEPTLRERIHLTDLEAYAEWGRQQGRCEGLAYAIAVMTNPYAPDLPAIKEEAMRRWVATIGTEESKESSRSGATKPAPGMHGDPNPGPKRTDTSTAGSRTAARRKRGARSVRGAGRERGAATDR